MPHWHPGGNELVRDTVVEVQRRESHLLSDEEAWGFDVHGFLIIRDALRGAELAECQALAAEGIQPAPPPPPRPSQLNYQPPPPPPAPGMVGTQVGMAYPTTTAQAFAPGYSGGYGPPPAQSRARQTVQDLAHTAGHSFASSAGQAAGHAAGGLL